jgi:hypothetical protein
VPGGHRQQRQKPILKAKKARSPMITVVDSYQNDSEKNFQHRKPNV